MSTWATLKAEIQAEINEADFNTGGTSESQLLIWANRVQLDIARALPVNYLMQTDQATLTATNYIWSLPTDFLKVHPVLTKVRVDDDYIEIVDLDELNEMDADHDETTTNTYPDYVAIEGNYLYVYPMFAGTIVLENYYRKPTDMSATTDSPDLPNVPEDLIVQGVLGYAYKWINEPELEAESRAIFELKLNDYRYYLERTKPRFRPLTTEYY